MHISKDDILETIAFNIDSPYADRAPVIRNYALSVPAFDFLKRLQREAEVSLGLSLTNGQALESLLKDYAALRLLTVENPSWDADEARDAAFGALERAGKLREVPFSARHQKVMRTLEAPACKECVA